MRTVSPCLRCEHETCLYCQDHIRYGPGPQGATQGFAGSAWRSAGGLACPGSPDGRHHACQHEPQYAT